MDKLIIWDYNGTICDDIEHSLSCINIMLLRRGLRSLSLKRYREIFGFPVIDYYRAAGFDFSVEPYEQLAVEYIDLYETNLFSKIRLKNGAYDTLQKIKDKNVPQIILSASEQSSLLNQLNGFKIIDFFDTVLASSNIYAHSKKESALAYIGKINPKKMILIGDTLHDSQIADEIGADCLLVSGGHQSDGRLIKSGKTVVGDIKEVVNFIL